MEIVQERLRREYDLDDPFDLPVRRLQGLSRPTARSSMLDNPADHAGRFDDRAHRASRSSSVASSCPGHVDIGDMIAAVSRDSAASASAPRPSTASRVDPDVRVLPLNEIIVDFNDQHEVHHPRLRLDGLRARASTATTGPGEDGHPRQRASRSTRFSSIVPPRPRPRAAVARICQKLKELIAAPAVRGRHRRRPIGGKVIARETIRAVAQGRDREVLRR
jgi:translation elongation factor EF-4